MNIPGPGCLTKQAFVVCALMGGMLPLAAAPGAAKASAAEAPPPPLVEAFQKGPISLSAKVTRTLGGAEQSVMPLFQVPVLKFQDKLDLAFSGEAFDQRVTPADWSLVVVFLPRTIAPTEQGVVDFTLKRKDDRMVIPTILVPYDSIPMIFLIPDKNAKKKVLQDLNDHLEAFRTLCAKISEIATERAAADKFLQDLDAIDKSLSPAQYDNALQGFLHAYGDGLSGDLQGFLGTPSSNLDKCSFLTEEFRATNVLVPGSTPAEAVAPPVAMTPGARPVSAYVSIIFDLAAIVNNLWPGHQFQYLPAVARDFHDTSADLYYSSWIRTTGDVRGALMCCPGNWEDQEPPAFDFQLPAGESLMRKQVLLEVRPKDDSRGPFALFGHDWKLLLSGPKGEPLPPIPLAVSPGRKAFVASPAPILEALGELGATQVKARIVGRWGFASIAQGAQALAIGCDPGWAPTPEETAAFQLGKACSFTLPAAWAGAVAKVSFLPSVAGATPILAQLTTAKDGSRTAVFTPLPGDAGPGSLTVTAIGSGKPALVRPLTLAEAAPEVTGIEARPGESALVLHGKHLAGVHAVEIGERRFLPAVGDTADGPVRSFRSADGKALEGAVGKAFQLVLVTGKGERAAKIPAVLLAPRPRIEEVRFTRAEAKTTSLAITSTVPLAATIESGQVSLLTARGYRFPADGAFRIALRNPEDPLTIRTILPAKIRVMGRDQKATFIINPAALLGGMADGKLELQVQDDHAGTGDWLPLPPTFLELPTIGAVQLETTGFRLTGESLDQIEAVAANQGGPWEKTSISIEEGREVAKSTLPLAGDTCFLKLFGWDDLVLTVKFPVLPSKPKAMASLPPPEPKDEAAAPPVAPQKETAALAAPVVASADPEPPLVESKP